PAHAAAAKLTLDGIGSAERGLESGKEVVSHGPELDSPGCGMRVNALWLANLSWDPLSCPGRKFVPIRHICIRRIKQPKGYRRAAWPPSRRRTAMATSPTTWSMSALILSSVS